MTMAHVYSCVLAVWISTLFIQSEQGLLPMPRKNGQHNTIRNLNEPAIKVFNRHEVQTPNQNMKYRKLSLEALKHYKPRLQYNAQGRHIITQPRNDDDRKLNAMLNKAIKYKTEDEIDGLRSNLQDIFTAEDIEQMEKIVGELSWDHPHFRKSNDKELVVLKPQMVYNFDDLVL